MQNKSWVRVYLFTETKAGFYSPANLKQSFTTLHSLSSLTLKHTSARTYFYIFCLQLTW